MFDATEHVIDERPLDARLVGLGLRGRGQQLGGHRPADRRFHDSFRVEHGDVATPPTHFDYGVAARGTQCFRHQAPRVGDDIDGGTEFGERRVRIVRPRVALGLPCLREELIELLRIRMGDGRVESLPLVQLARESFDELVHQFGPPAIDLEELSRRREVTSALTARPSDSLAPVGQQEPERPEDRIGQPPPENRYEAPPLDLSKQRCNPVVEIRIGRTQFRRRARDPVVTGRAELVARQGAAQSLGEGVEPRPRRHHDVIARQHGGRELEHCIELLAFDRELFDVRDEDLLGRLVEAGSGNAIPHRRQIGHRWIGTFGGRLGRILLLRELLAKRRHEVDCVLGRVLLDRAEVGQAFVTRQLAQVRVVDRPDHHRQDRLAQRMGIRTLEPTRR